MGKKITARCTVSVTEQRTADLEVDVDEFAEWGGNLNNPRDLFDFIQSGSDYETVLGDLVERSAYVPGSDDSDLLKVEVAP